MTEDVLPDEIEVDRMMLESYGISITEDIDRRINESTVRDDKDKRFGVDFMFVFDADDACEDIERNDVFDYYLNNEIYAKLDSCMASRLIDMWQGDFVHDSLVNWLNDMDKGEVLRYDDFFRHLLAFSESDAVLSLVDSTDKRFELMPHVVRIF